MAGVADDEFLTVDEVAGRLRVNPQTVRNWVAAGKCPAVRIGRGVRIRRSDAESLGAAPPHLKPGPRPHPTPQAQGFWEGSWLAEAEYPQAPPTSAPSGTQGPSKAG